MMKTYWACFLAIVAAGQVLAAPKIVGFSEMALTGSNLTASTTAAVEWAPTAAGPWTNSWESLTAIPVDSNGVIQVPVAFFYRLKDNIGAVTSSSTTSTSTTTTSSSTSAVTTTTTTSTSSTAQPPTGAVIAFVGINCDGNDDFALAALTNIPASVTIYFTDQEWNGLPIGGGGSFNGAEHVITWNTGPGVSAGTVVAFTNLNSTSLATRGVSIGSIVGPMNLSALDEAIFAFEGTSTNNPTIFLAAIANNGDTPLTYGSLAGTGLDTNTTAVTLTGSVDIAQYIGPRTGYSGAGYLPVIANVTTNSWIGEGTGGNDSINAIPPDLPFDLTPFAP